MMMMMSTFTAGESINLYAKCAERGGGGGGWVRREIESQHNQNKEKEKRM